MDQRGAKSKLHPADGGLRIGTMNDRDDDWRTIGSELNTLEKTWGLCDSRDERF